MLSTLLKLINKSNERTELTSKINQSPFLFSSFTGDIHLTDYLSSEKYIIRNLSFYPITLSNKITTSTIVFNDLVVNLQNKEHEIIVKNIKNNTIGSIMSNNNSNNSFYKNHPEHISINDLIFLHNNEAMKIKEINNIKNFTYYEKYEKFEWDNYENIISQNYIDNKLFSKIFKYLNRPYDKQILYLKLNNYYIKEINNFESNNQNLLLNAAIAFFEKNKEAIIEIDDF